MTITITRPKAKKSKRPKRAKKNTSGRSVGVKHAKTRTIVR